MIQISETCVLPAPALEFVKTEKVFMLDVDFFTHYQIRSLINSGLIDRELGLLNNKTVLVLPAFEVRFNQNFERFGICLIRK